MQTCDVLFNFIKMLFFLCVFVCFWLWRIWRIKQIKTFTKIHLHLPSQNVKYCKNIQPHIWCTPSNVTFLLHWLWAVDCDAWDSQLNATSPGMLLKIPSWWEYIHLNREWKLMLGATVKASSCWIQFLLHYFLLFTSLPSVLLWHQLNCLYYYLFHCSVLKADLFSNGSLGKLLWFTLSSMPDVLQHLKCLPSETGI